MHAPTRLVSSHPRLFAALLALAGGVTGLQAQLSVYEGFEYNAGSTLPPEEQSGFGWDGGWYNNANTENTAGSRGLVQAGSLDTPPGMIAAGNHLAMNIHTATGERVFADAHHIDTNQNSVTFFSVLGSVTTNSWGVGLYSDRGMTDNPVVSLRVTAGSAVMRLYDAFPYETADGAFTRTIASNVTGTFLWVARLETSAGNDRLDAWIYTDLAGVPGIMPALQPAPGAGVVPGSNVNIYNVDALIDRVGYGLFGGSSLDEIRLGADWQSVTMGAAVIPEPATVALLIGGGALALVILRRRWARAA